MKRIHFFDDSQVVGWVNVTRQIHRPRKHPANPVMSKSTPWEDAGMGWHWPSVLFDEEQGLFKAWYECIIDGHGFGAYAVSGDGLRWERPDLGLVAWKGSRKNNLFYKGTIRRNLAICPNVIKRGPGDWHLYYWDAVKASHSAGVIHYTGTDGIHWKLGRTNPVVQTPVDRTRSGGVEDVLRVSYDPRKEQFLLSQRTLPLENLERPLLQKKVPSGLTQRRVSLATSKDGERFTPTRTVLTPELNDPPDTQFYGLSPFRYEDAYLGYLLCYRTGRPGMDVELAYSADGTSWRRVAPNVRYLANGPKEYDIGLIHCAPHPIHVGDKHYVYYHGTNSDHAGETVTGNPRCSNLSLAIGDADRIVSVRAGAKSGSVLVGPVKVEGNRLAIDANARRGEMRVALRDSDTRHEIRGLGVKQSNVVSSDSKRHIISWNGESDLRCLRSQSVLVQVYLMRGDLFSIGWES